MIIILTSISIIVQCYNLFIFTCISLDLQNVDITLRLLFRPKEEKLPWIFSNVGVDFEERVLPSITTEVLKAVVVSDTVGIIIIIIDAYRLSLTLVSSLHSVKW